MEKRRLKEEEEEGLNIYSTVIYIQMERRGEGSDDHKELVSVWER